MYSPQIKITRIKGQPIKVEVLNAQGSSCKNLTTPLEKLGATETTLKPEFYSEAQLSITDNISIGGDW